MSTTYPKTERISLGYSPKEDRLVLTAHLQQGQSRRALLTRRMLSNLLERLSSELSSTHPGAERSPEPDQVLQMEHLAAVSGAPAEGSNSSSETDIAGNYLVTSIQLETQESQLVLGFLGQSLDSLEPDKGQAEPVAGIKLGRAQAHQVLKMLQDQAQKADWALGRQAAWMAPLRIKRTGLNDI